MSFGGLLLGLGAGSRAGAKGTARAHTQGPDPASFCVLPPARAKRSVSISGRRPGWYIGRPRDARCGGRAAGPGHSAKCHATAPSTRTTAARLPEHLDARSGLVGNFPTCSRTRPPPLRPVEPPPLSRSLAAYGSDASPRERSFPNLGQIAREGGWAGGKRTGRRGAHGRPRRGAESVRDAEVRMGGGSGGGGLRSRACGVWEDQAWWRACAAARGAAA